MRGWLRKVAALGALAFATAFADVPTETMRVGQSVADVLSAAAGTQHAIVAEGLLRAPLQKDNLASALLYPTDEVVVVALKGSQVRQAFERAASLYPRPNPSFLYTAGFEVVVDPTKEPGARIVSVTAAGAKLEEDRTYEIAMPSSLGRGGLGYFKVWDRSKIVRAVPGVTVEDVMKGKPVGSSAPRWSER
ncbi:MAG: 5'-nucleotidase C-terminal domain-containing protein [Fimbriimonadales bacterium]|nr:5'-nucleotidase C-terminal domain-containing protein [Fimbriimonadales bacterium]